jgi:hypothetical protein
VINRFATAFKTVCRNVMVKHSADDRVEQATQVKLDGMFNVGNHEYPSNFVVATAAMMYFFGCRGMWPTIQRYLVLHVWCR